MHEIDVASLEVVFQCAHSRYVPFGINLMHISEYRDAWEVWDTQIRFLMDNQLLVSAPSPDGRYFVIAGRLVLESQSGRTHELASMHSPQFPFLPPNTTRMTNVWMQRQREEYRQELLAWVRALVEEGRLTLQNLQRPQSQGSF